MRTDLNQLVLAEKRAELNTYRRLLRKLQTDGQDATLRHLSMCIGILESELAVPPPTMAQRHMATVQATLPASNRELAELASALGGKLEGRHIVFSDRSSIGILESEWRPVQTTQLGPRGNTGPHGES